MPDFETMPTGSLKVLTTQDIELQELRNRVIDAEAALACYDPESKSLYRELHPTGLAQQMARAEALDKLAKLDADVMSVTTPDGVIVYLDDADGGSDAPEYTTPGFYRFSGSKMVSGPHKTAADAEAVS